MHQYYTTRAVFLKKEDRGEADQVLTVFSEKFGKLKITAKGIRKITSKLRPGADLFYFSEISFIQGRYYKTLTDAVLIGKFAGIQASPEKLEAAFQIADALDCLTKEESPDQEIWRLLLSVLENLQRSDPNRFCLGLTSTYFFWKLFVLLGYQPAFAHCPIRLNKNSIGIIKFFLEEPIEKVKNLEISQRDIENLEKISHAYFQYVKNCP